LHYASPTQVDRDSLWQSSDKKTDFVTQLVLTSLPAPLIDTVRITTLLMTSATIQKMEK